MTDHLPAVTGADLRHVLGHFGTGVIVVTAATAAGPAGLTCQTFQSLSLEPPLVSFSPSRASRSWPLIRDTGRFCVNVLAADQSDLSVTFATPGIDKFADVSWHAGPHGSPVLDGVIAWIECSLWREYDGGDHTIAVGEVLALSAESARQPLLYLRGQYLEGPASA